MPKLRLWALDTGTLTLDASVMMHGGGGEMTIPIVCHLIRHPRGLVLFDTGIVPEAAVDPIGAYGKFAETYAIRCTDEQLLVNQLKLIGYTPEQVTHVVLSHAHVDHTGGLALFEHAKLYAGAGELRYAMWPDKADELNFHRPDIEATRGFKWFDVEGDLDLFGDGLIILLSLPGHTPGNLGLRVRLTSGEIIIAGDTVHLHEALEETKPSGGDYDTLTSKRSIQRLAQLRDTTEATVWVPHDPVDAQKFGFAPHYFE